MSQTRKQNVAGSYLTPGDNPTCTASGAITGQRFVKVVTGGVGNKPKVSTPGAGDKVFGVAEYNSLDTADVSVKRKGAWDVKAGAALTGGQEVQSDAAGQAIVLASGKAAGICLADTASGGIAPIMLYS